MGARRNAGSRAATLGRFLLCAALAAITGFAAQPAEAAPFAYVTDWANGVSVVDTNTNTAVATLPVMTGWGVAVAPDGKHAYITTCSGNNCNAGEVLVLDTATNAVVATVAVPNMPMAIALTPDGKRAYVTTATEAGAVWGIDTVKNMVVSWTNVCCIYRPGSIAITPDGKRIYIPGEIIDTATSKVVGDFETPYYIVQGIAISPDGKRAYVTAHDGFVKVLDTATNATVATIQVGNFAKGIAIAPDGARIYVRSCDTSCIEPSVSVIDTAANAVIARIPVGPSLDSQNDQGLAITPDGKRVYVLSCTNSCGTLVVEAIDVAARKVIATIPIGESMPVQSIAIIPDIPLSFFTSKLFISQSKSYFELLSNIPLGAGRIGSIR